MPYYVEPVRRELNSQGRPRLVSGFVGATCLGFDGDGRPPAVGEEAGRFRLWRTTGPVPPLVAGLTSAGAKAFIAAREAAKPVHPARIVADPLRRPLTPDENARVRAMLEG